MHLSFYCFRELNISIPKNVRNNGTLYIHCVILPERSSKGDLSLQEAIREPEATYVKGHLTRYAYPKSYAFNLLQDKNQSQKQSVKPVTHIKSKYAIIMCTDELKLPHTGIPPEIIRLLRINSKYQFLPIIQQDFMQTRLRDLVEITDETKTATFSFTYSPASIGTLRFLLQIEATLKQFLTLGFTEKDLDEIKGVFADTNVYLLCATVLIGSIHVSFS